MSHITPDYFTKKTFKEAVKSGQQIRVTQPGGIFPQEQDGVAYIEAPAEYHKWYSKVEIKNGIVTKVLS